MIGPIDSIEFRMTSNTAEHLAQLQSVIITAKSVIITTVTQSSFCSFTCLKPQNEDPR